MGLCLYITVWARSNSWDVQDAKKQIAILCWNYFYLNNFFRFSNPLFDGKRPQRSPTKRVHVRRHHLTKSPTPLEETLAASLPPQFNLIDAPLPDFSRPPDQQQQQQQQQLKQFEYIDISPNVSRDSLHLESDIAYSRDFASSDAMSHAAVGGLFNMDDNSSSNSSDIPPALPRKTSRGPPQPPRKISQYDNVNGPHHSPLTFAASAPFPGSERPLPSLRSVSTLSSFQVIPNFFAHYCCAHYKMSNMKSMKHWIDTKIWKVLVFQRIIIIFR